MRHRKVLSYSMFPSDTPIKCRMPGSREYEMVTFVRGPVAYEADITDGGFGIRMYETRTGIEVAGRDFMAVRTMMHERLLARETELAGREADGLSEAEAEQLAHLRRWHRHLCT